MKNHLRWLRVINLKLNRLIIITVKIGKVREKIRLLAQSVHSLQRSTVLVLQRLLTVVKSISYSIGSQAIGKIMKMIKINKMINNPMILIISIQQKNLRPVKKVRQGSEVFRLIKISSHHQNNYEINNQSLNNRNLRNSNKMIGRAARK